MIEIIFKKIKEIEIFLSDYPNIIDVLGVIAAFTVVFVSLHLARKSYKPKIKVFLDKRALVKDYKNNTVTEENIDNSTKYIIAYIDNIGSREVSIPFGAFYYGLFSKKSYDSPNTLDSDHWSIKQVDISIPRKKYPFIIYPDRSEVFFVQNLKDFINYIIKKKKSYSKLPFFFFFFKIKVITSNGQRFTVKISRSLKEEIKKSLKKKLISS